MHLHSPGCRLQRYWFRIESKEDKKPLILSIVSCPDPLWERKEFQDFTREIAMLWLSCGVLGSPHSTDMVEQPS